MALGIIGCDTNVNEPAQETGNPYSFVGEKHSEGLEYAFAKFEAASSAQENARPDLQQLAKRSSSEYIKRESLDLKHFDAVELSMGVAFPGIADSRANTQESVSVKTSFSRIQSLPDSVLSKLSSEQVQFVNQIMHLVDSEPTVPELENDLESINSEVRAELEEDEARVVLIASTVALDSWTYWNQNGEKWIAMARENQSSNASTRSAAAIARDFSWGEVGKSDIAGGIGGAAGGAVAGAFAGGVGAGPGAAAGGAGGAVGGSVGSAAKQVLDSWW